ncbi:MAG: hypothetical protein AB7V56_13845 [Candidatus Nitrosocosmicus sp.]
MTTPENLPRFFEYAIHTLYAVVIGLGFEVSNSIVIPIEKIPEHWNNALVLFLGYSLLVSSWIGYYLSIRKHSHKGKLGFFRFIIDIFVVYIFYYLIYLSKVALDPNNRQYLDDVFLILPLIYGVYLVWDIIKYYEHKKKSQSKIERTDKISRIGITIDYLLIFVIISIFYYAIPVSDHLEIKQSIFVIAAIIFIMKYRYAKWTSSNTSNQSTNRKAKRKNEKNTLE